MHWNLKVRVIRLWIVPDKFKSEIPYSLEMILQDEKGDRIHASLGKTVIKHFGEILYELGVFRMNYFVIAPNIMKFKTTTHKHKLNFTVTTNVKEIQDPSFHMDIFNIRTFDKLTIHHNVDETELLDVVGHVASYQPIQQIKQGDDNSYFINIVLEDDKNLPFGLLQKSSVWNLTMDGHTWLATIVINCITKVDTEGTKYYCKKCNSEVKFVIHRYRLQLSVMDGTAFISILLWNKETIQLLGKTAKELKEGLLEDDESSYPTEIGDLMEKKFMFKILIKDSNINRKDNVYKVVNFTDDDTLLKEFCHPDLQDSLNTPNKSSISECRTLITEDVIDLTTKISTKSSKAARKSTRHEIKDDLNVKQPSNKIRKVIKKEKNT
ncbi:hypothetical protein KY284_035968 [Solanum tuberosum]|nr:hypothetical protein KY284_035968 [Solanum tuberosum]